MYRQILIVIAIPLSMLLSSCSKSPTQSEKSVSTDPVIAEPDKPLKTNPVVAEPDKTTQKSPTIGERGKPDKKELTFMELTKAAEDLIGMKGIAYPYDVEYDLAYLPNPGARDMEPKLRFIAEDKRSYYSENVSDSSTSRIFVKGNEFYWESRSEYGTYLFKAEINIGDAHPGDWLQDHGFDDNTPPQMSADFLLGRFRYIIGSSEASRTSQAGREKVIWFSSGGKERTKMTMTDESVDLYNVASQSAEERLFHFALRKRVPPPSADPRRAFLEKYSVAAKNEIVTLRGDFTLFSAFENEIGIRATVEHPTVEKAEELAKKWSYLFPVKHKASIKRIDTYRGELSLVMQAKDRQYTITQGPLGARFDIPKDFVRNKRQVESYDASEIIDPGTGARFVYYTKADVMLMVSDAGDFMDPELDRLILTFEKIKH